MLILVGNAGVGKTAVRDLLAARLGRPALGPDDFPDRWDDVYLRLDDSCILECCQIPERVWQRITDTTTVVELTAPTEVRKERLQQQGLNPLEVGKRLLENQNGNLAYDLDVRVAMTVETIGTPRETVDQIMENL